jgi:hypothetical protein
LLGGPLSGHEKLDEQEVLPKRGGRLMALAGRD